MNMSTYNGKNSQVSVMTAVKHALILLNKSSLWCKIQHLDLKAKQALAALNTFWSLVSQPTPLRQQLKKKLNNMGISMETSMEMASI